MDARFRKRFWSKVRITDDDSSCWEWLASTTDGYGKFHTGPGTTNDRAHRVAYRLEIGPITNGQDVMHVCDNRRCCRPDHLVLGSRAENTADMVAKNRQAKGTKKWTAKMTDAQVLELRERHASGETISSLAGEFGISVQNGSQIAFGDTWKHVGGPRRTRRTFRTRRNDP